MDDQQDFRFYINVLSGGRQGERIEIPLLDRMTENTFPWILEDEEISFKLIAPGHMQNPILWISDLPKPPSYSRTLDNKIIYIWHPESRGTNRYQAFFLNCFGSCQLDIEMRKQGGEQQWIELAPFEVKAKKITADRLREMIKYLSSRVDDLAGASFSVTQVAAEQTKGRKRVTSFLKEVEEGLSLFEKQLPILLGKHCTRLVPKRVVHMPRPDHYFEANTSEWLLSHLDILIPVPDFNEAVAIIDNRPYTVNRLEVNELVEDSNVYENQVLHSYLNSIKTLLLEIRKECDRLESQTSSGPVRSGEPFETPSYRNGSNNRYVSFSNEIKSSVGALFKGRKAKCDQLMKKCNYLMRVLDEKIPVRRLLVGMPSLTPWVKANIHYRILFEKIIRWYQMGTADWSDEEALVGVRSIDELYEYFCLYKLIDGLEKLGFQRKDIPDAKTQEMVYQDSMPKHKYEFQKSGMSLILYYEKEIWSPRYKAAREEPYLNVEGWIWDTYRKKGKRTRFNSKRVPDYIFEISMNQDRPDPSGKNSILAIFDAKYSPADIVFFEKLPLLVMRYVHGISRRQGGFSPVISLYLLHPKDTDKGPESEAVRSFYTNAYDLFGNNAVIPALGAAEVDPASTWDISRLIGRIVALAEQELQT
ncbi:hypothetical protein [Desulfonema magnum]|uniref:DUF2357 domain-containing protein n=1 Tax=Desulfonema magnum TaxID=45655 RepID=A0A975BJT3_9BACT|nr:hypothetical protein [Desulfonema magnum]QTA86690.1 Uncharacterized protein dnm_027140 [Desulfonema magnum]